VHVTPDDRRVVIMMEGGAIAPSTSGSEIGNEGEVMV
jgi:hypothetical protein